MIKRRNPINWIWLFTEMMGKRVFQLHVTIPTYVSLQGQTQDKLNSLLSLLELSKFLNYFPANNLQMSYFILLLQPNKIVKGHKTHIVGRQSLNDHNCQI